MIQYEQFSEASKKAIEKFRNDNCFGKKVWPASLLYFYLMNDCGGWNYIEFLKVENEINSVIALAKSKNYWLTDTKKEENKK